MPDQYTPAEWIEAANKRVVVDIGHLTRADRSALDRQVRKKTIAKWRGYWFPIPGASWGMGPIKTCYGPLEIYELVKAL